MEGIDRRFAKLPQDEQAESRNLLVSSLMFLETQPDVAPINTPLLREELIRLHLSGELLTSFCESYGGIHERPQQATGTSSKLELDA